MRPSEGEHTRRPAERKPAWLPRAERSLVRRMLVGAAEARAVRERLDGIGFSDPLLARIADALYGRAVADPRAGEPYLNSTGEPDLDAAIEHLLKEPPVGEEAWLGYAARLVEYRLREQLMSVEGRLESEAESAEDNDGRGELYRLMGLLMEYHEVRWRVYRERNRRKHFHHLAERVTR